MNDKRFEELLEKALAGSITEEEEKELLQDYIKPETAEVFPFIQLACDHKYIPAYYHLGNMYKKVSGAKNPYTWLGFNGRFLFRMADADSLKSGIVTGSAQVA